MVTNAPVASANDFPAAPIRTSAATLGANSSNPAGATSLTIQGGSAQDIPAGTVIGEIFKWTGVNSTLNSIDFVCTGSGGKGTYQVFLFDLGTGTFFTSDHAFAPKNHKNMFNAGDTITVTGTATKRFLELDFTGTDMVTLRAGHSYAFGLFSTSAVSDLFIERSGGGASDAYGYGFTATSLYATTVSASPFGDSVRNVFVGVYAAPLAEPVISMAMAGNSDRQ
jgi:hypothetical protein